MFMQRYLRTMPRVLVVAIGSEASIPASTIADSRSDLPQPQSSLTTSHSFCRSGTWQSGHIITSVSLALCQLIARVGSEARRARRQPRQPLILPPPLREPSILTHGSSILITSTSEARRHDKSKGPPRRCSQRCQFAFPRCSRCSFQAI